MKPDLESLLTRTRRLLHPKPPAADRLKILGLLAEERDRGLLAAAGTQNQWDVTFASSYAQAHDLLEKIRAPVVLCDRDLLEQDWWSVVEGLSTCTHRASILLVSRVADEYLWNEIVRRGGYDILSKPLVEAELVRGVKLAWSYWSTAARR